MENQLHNGAEYDRPIAVSTGHVRSVFSHQPGKLDRVIAYEPISEVQKINPLVDGTTYITRSICANKCSPQQLEQWLSGNEVLQDVEAFYAPPHMTDAQLAKLVYKCPLLKKLSLRSCELITQAGLIDSVLLCTELCELDLYQISRNFTQVQLRYIQDCCFSLGIYDSCCQLSYPSQFTIRKSAALEQLFPLLVPHE